MKDCTIITRIIPVIGLLMVLAAGCARHDGDYKLPGVYRIDIMQGNVLTQEMIDRLRPGMNKNQVRFIMGTPAIEDPFHVDRWDYIYTRAVRGSQRKQLHVSLYFEEDELTYLDGDVVSSIRRPPEEYLKKSRVVDVPLRERRNRSLLGSVIGALPFVGDDEPKPPVTDPEPDPESDPEPDPDSPE